MFASRQDAQRLQGALLGPKQLIQISGDIRGPLRGILSVFASRAQRQFKLQDGQHRSELIQLNARALAQLHRPQASL